MESNQNPYNPTKSALHFRYRILFTLQKDGERQKEHLVHLKCKCANNDDKHAAQAARHERRLRRIVHDPQLGAAAPMDGRGVRRVLQRVRPDQRVWLIVDASDARTYLPHEPIKQKHIGASFAWSAERCAGTAESPSGTHCRRTSAAIA